MREEADLSTGVADPPEEGSPDQGSLADRGQRSAQGTAGAGAPDNSGGVAGLEALKETPFKDVKQLVDGFKNLQREVNKRSQGGSADQTVQALVRQLATMAQGNKTGGEKINPDAFLKAFLADPAGTLAAAIEKRVRDEASRLETKYDSQFTNNARESQLKEFVNGKGKELNADEQERFLAIVDQNPALSHLPNALDVYLSLLIAEDPAKYQANRNKASGGGQSLRDAKESAGGYGGKGTSVATQGGKKKDEFDDVLDLYESETASSRRSGRAASGGFTPKDPRRG